MKIYLNEKLLTDKCRAANSFFEKLFGRIFIHAPLVINNCNSVHTFFMKEKIDVIFLDKDYTIIKLCHSVKPYHIIFPVKNSKYVLESDASFIKNAKINLRDKLVFAE